MARRKPEVVIPIDSSFINLRIAAAAKEEGLKVCYYVAPQLWAWAPWRMKKLRQWVDRVACVVDCGVAINLAGLEGQIESGITWGLSAALHGKIDFRDGRALQESYTDFEVMRMDESPVIETHLVASTADPTGVGEPGLPPIAPALCNAIFAATGKRIRSLPIEAALEAMK